MSKIYAIIVLGTTVGTKAYHEDLDDQILDCEQCSAMPDWPDSNCVSRPPLRLPTTAKWLLLMTAFGFFTSAEAFDNEPAGMVPFNPQQFGATDASASWSFPMPEVIQLAIGAVTATFILSSGYLTGAARTLLGPLMGITSVLWFIMRNDAAISPTLSWM